VIKERDEARKIYEQARNAGYTAAPLDQEPNTYPVRHQHSTQWQGSNQAFCDRALKYEAGVYEFAFPLVGPVTFRQPARGRPRHHE
jgi:hypothetical protein